MHINISKYFRNLLCCLGFLFKRTWRCLLYWGFKNSFL